MLINTTQCALSDEFVRTLKAALKSISEEEDVCAGNFPLSFRIYFFLKYIYIYFTYVLSSTQGMNTDVR